MTENNDRSYRVLVLLQRSDRPMHWMFHCPNCKRELREVDNQVLIAMSDSFNVNDKQYGKAQRCDTGWCRYYYVFKLSE